MTTTIYTAYHKLSARVESRSITPIHVGRAGAKAPLPDMIGDDTGENISELNGKYCELTALYWAWKNDTSSERIGLMHYRRLFDFDGAHPSADAEVFLGELDLQDYARDAQTWLDAHPEVDLVLPKPHKMHISVRENYVAEHDAADIAAVERILSERHPEYLSHFKAVFDGNDLWLANMFVARREIFTAYCDWIFDVLGALDAAQDREWLSPYNARYLGFMSERLFQVWLKKYLADNEGTKVHRCNILNLSRALTYPFLSGDVLNDAHEVNVAFSSDVNYLPHTAAMVRSLVDHVDPARQYNLFYLHEDIPGRDLELLGTILFGVPNVTLHLVNVGSPFAASYRSAHHAPTNATFNRFLLFRLLPDVDRLLYIDVDMILLGDVAEIFDTEMGEHLLAAVPDYIMTRVLTTKVVTDNPAVPDLGAYLGEKLGMSDEQISLYFNAGLMVLNFKEMDVAKVGKDLLEMVEETQYFFRDQDILNAYFKDRYLKIDARYNVFNSDEHEYAEVPVAQRAEALRAKHDPFLIHYAAWQHKPWTYPDTQFSDLYWRALERTPFHKRVLLKLIEDAQRSTLAPLHKRAAHKVVGLGIKTADRFPALRPYLLRGYHGLRGAKHRASALIKKAKP